MSPRTQQPGAHFLQLKPLSQDQMKALEQKAVDVQSEMQRLEVGLPKMADQLNWLRQTMTISCSINCVCLLRGKLGK